MTRLVPIRNEHGKVVRTVTLTSFTTTARGRWTYCDEHEYGCEKEASYREITDARSGYDYSDLCATHALAAFREMVAETVRTTGYKTLGAPYTRPSEMFVRLTGPRSAIG